MSRPFTPETLVGMRRISGMDLSPDGRWAVLAVDELSDDGKCYVTNLLRVDLADGSKRWLTRDDRKKGSPRFLDARTIGLLAQPDPQGKRPTTLPERDAGKGEKPDDPAKAPRQLARLPVDGGAPEQVTDLPCGVDAFAPSRHGFALLASSHAEAASVDDNRRLEAAEKDRKSTGQLYDSYPLRFWDHWHGPRHAHVVATDALGGDARDLTPRLGFGLFESTLDTSRDGRWACVDMTTVDAERRFLQHLEVVDLETGARRALTEGQQQHGSPRWSPDGTRIAALTWRNEERKTGKRDLAIVDVASGQSRIVTEGLDLWPERALWIDDSRVVFAHDWRGHHVLRLLDTRSGETRLLTERGNASDAHVSADGKHLYFALDRIDDPPDLWRIAISGGQPERVARLNEDKLDGLALSPAESLVVKGAGGRDVQLWEVRPRDFDPKKRYPLLLWIHGGPVHSYLDQFHFRWNAQIYTALGYVVIMVNPRGSTGFGQDFIEGNNGNWGDLCYLDLMAVTDEWSRKPYVDAGRIAALGASFGGYMVNWLAGREKRFRCLVSHAGLFHLPSFHGTTDAGPEWELEFGGKPWENPELYDKWSPHRAASQFTTPTLVIHGDLDYRVPIGEGLQMFLALQRQGVPSQFLFFPDENHWILKPPNMLQWNQTVIAWLARWMS